MNVRIGTVQAKGYHLHQFDDAFERYIPLPPGSPRPIVPNGGNVRVSGDSGRVPNNPRDAAQPPEKPQKTAIWDAGRGENTEIPPGEPEIDAEDAEDWRGDAWEPNNAP